MMLQHKKEWLVRTKRKNAWLATPEYPQFYDRGCTKKVS
jgi:hypothetical protein